MDNASHDYVKGVIEAILFVNERPVSLNQIKDSLESVSAGEIKKTIGELQNEYEEQRRGFVIAEIAEGYQMLSSPHYVNTIRNFFKTKVKDKLSRPALETLAIIAYKQPVSRADVEIIRGVNSDGVVQHLLNRGLIKIVGRKDVPGRPYLHGTTKLFLEYFGLKSLEDLPKLEEFPALIEEREAAEKTEAENADSQGEPSTAAAEAGEKAAAADAGSAEESVEAGEEHADETAEVAGRESEQDAEEEIQASALDLKKAMEEVDQETEDRENNFNSTRQSRLADDETDGELAEEEPEMDALEAEAETEPGGEAEIETEIEAEAEAEPEAESEEDSESEIKNSIEDKS